MKYCIYDNVTKEYLLSWPKMQWGEGLGPDIFEFDSIERAEEIVKKLTTIFRKHQKGCEIDWSIMSIVKTPKIKWDVKIGKRVKQIKK